MLFLLSNGDSVTLPHPSSLSFSLPSHLARAHARIYTHAHASGRVNTHARMHARTHTHIHTHTLSLSHHKHTFLGGGGGGGSLSLSLSLSLSPHTFPEGRGRVVLALFFLFAFVLCFPVHSAKTCCLLAWFAVVCRPAERSGGRGYWHLSRCAWRKLYDYVKSLCDTNSAID